MMIVLLLLLLQYIIYVSSTCVLPTPYSLNIEIKTDTFPGETGWFLKDGGTGNLVAYVENNYTEENTVYSHDFCISGGCWELNITDAYGDGMCCNWGDGDGYYKITYDGEEIFSGGEMSEKILELDWCGGPTPRPTSLAPTTSNSPTKTPTKSPTFEPTSIPSLNPSEVPTRSPVSVTILQSPPTVSPAAVQKNSTVEAFASGTLNIETTDGSIHNENVNDVIPLIEDTIDTHLPEFASCAITKVAQQNGNVFRRNDDQLGFTVLFEIFIDVVCTESPCNCNDLASSKFDEAVDTLESAVQSGLFQSTLQQSGNGVLSAVEVIDNSLSPELAEIFCKTLSPTMMPQTLVPTATPTSIPTSTPTIQYSLFGSIFDNVLGFVLLAAPFVVAGVGGLIVAAPLIIIGAIVLAVPLMVLAAAVAAGVALWIIIP